VWG
jgi:cation-transporting ATPase 13A1